MNRTAWILTCGLALLAWQPPLPQSEAGKAPDAPKVIVLKGTGNVKVLRPKEVAKPTTVRPQGLSAVQKMQILKMGHGVLPALQTGNTLVTKLRLTPRELYQPAGWLDYWGARTENGANIAYLDALPKDPFRSSSVRASLDLHPRKRYLVEFGVRNQSKQAIEFTLITSLSNDTHKITGSPTSIPVLLDVPEPPSSPVPGTRDRFSHFELTANGPWAFFYCEVTTLN